MTEKTRVDPYGFVRLPEGGPERLPAIPQHRFDGLSGRLECRLTAKTRLFVYHPTFARHVGSGHQEARFPVRDGVAVIPGSSLKGVIRSLAEAVAPGCFTLFDGPTYRGSGITRDQSLRADLPHEYRQCSRRAELCPTCRLFGFLRGNEVQTGKVHISDAISPQDNYTLMNMITLEVLSAPKPEGRPGAYTQQKKGQTVVRGRKFYRHRLDDVTPRAGGKKDRQNKTVQPVAPKSVFTFEVEYNDLRKEELRLLLYALALEPGLWHKVGLGKPIGLGSAHIEITAWEKIDRQARYKAFGSGIAEPLINQALHTELDTWLRPYRESDAPHLQDLRELWGYKHDYEVRYPAPQRSW
jgi:CRISPR/Cas system CSM-associated protein Csm3 (group 7 of RAMP superfamily)